MYLIIVMTPKNRCICCGKYLKGKGVIFTGANIMVTFLKKTVVSLNISLTYRKKNALKLLLIANDNDLYYPY